MHHYVHRETDSYKSHDFFLNPIMIILENVYLYITVNGNMNKYVKTKKLNLLLIFTFCYKYIKTFQKHI